MAEKQEQAYPTTADWKALDLIVRKANAGDQKALVQLRKFLDGNPQVWQHVGDIARTAEKAWITVIANGSSLAAEAIRRQLAELKTELMEGSSTVVDRMLVDTVVATWLELHYLRSVDADTRNRSVTQGSLLLKRLESAQRRHANALKQLTQIRKLLPNRGAMPQLRVYPYERETA
jgi:hypothetical protein